MSAPALRFNGFSEDWHLSTISNVASKVTDGTHDTPKPVPSGIPYLTAIHIKDGMIDYDNCYYLSEEEHKKIYKRCNPEKGDLLLVNIGAGTAACAMNTVDYEFSLKNVALIKPNRKLISPEFLAQYQRKNSLKLFNQITTGGAQPFLSLSEIGKIKVIFPSLPEQTKIANFLTVVDKKITQLTQKCDLLAQYKKGVMQQIFSQELRFKDDDGRDFPEWDETTLGDVCKPQQWKTIAASELTEFGYPAYGANGQIGFYSNYNHEDETVAVTCRGATCGEVSLIPPKSYITGNAMSLDDINPEDNNHRYVYYALILRGFRDVISGSAQPQIVGSAIRKVEFAKPTIKEQTKIANFLTAIDDKITNSQTQLQAVKQYKQGLLQQMFI